MSVIVGYSVKNTIGGLNKERVGKVMRFLDSQLSSSSCPLDRIQQSFAIIISNDFFKGQKALISKVVRHARPYKL